MYALGHTRFDWDVGRGMARILLAASSEPRNILERILNGHQLDSAKTLRQAERLLEANAYDAIVCTILFDDSRMFELLRHAKLNAQSQTIPFIGARLRPHVLSSPIALEGIRKACQTMGAAAFLDISDYSDPELEMRPDFERIFAAETDNDA
jgi:CheY-like chemotaxis protein